MKLIKATVKYPRCKQPLSLISTSARVRRCSGMAPRGWSNVVRALAKIFAIERARFQPTAEDMKVWARVIFRIWAIVGTPRSRGPTRWARISFSSSSAVGTCLVPSLFFKRCMRTPFVTILSIHQSRELSFSRALEMCSTFRSRSWQERLSYSHR